MQIFMKLCGSIGIGAAKKIIPRLLSQRVSLCRDVSTDAVSVVDCWQLIARSLVLHRVMDLYQKVAPQFL